MLNSLRPIFLTNPIHHLQIWSPPPLGFISQATYLTGTLEHLQVSSILTLTLLPLPPILSLHPYLILTELLPALPIILLLPYLHQIVTPPLSSLTNRSHLLPPTLIPYHHNNNLSHPIPHFQLQRHHTPNHYEKYTKNPTLPLNASTP